MENARRAAFSFFSKALGRLRSGGVCRCYATISCALRYKKVRCACGILKSWDVFISMRRGRAWKKRARRTATASLPLWARIPRFYISNNELERAKDAIYEWPLNLYVCRRGALWLAYHRTQTQSATQWEFVFNPSTDIDSYYSYDKLLVLGKSALSVPDTRFSRVSGSTLVIDHSIHAWPMKMLLEIVLAESEIHQKVFQQAKMHLWFLYNVSLCKTFFEMGYLYDLYFGHINILVCLTASLHCTDITGPFIKINNIYVS